MVIVDDDDVYDWLKVRTYFEINASFDEKYLFDESWFHKKEREERRGNIIGIEMKCWLVDELLLISKIFYQGCTQLWRRFWISTLIRMSKPEQMSNFPEYSHTK